MRKMTRRDFIKLLTDGLLTLSGIVAGFEIFRFLGYKAPPPPPKQYNIGPTSNYLIDTKTIIAEIPAVLIHNFYGFSAIDLTCQHLGCTVELKGDGFSCPCHGSLYGPKGELLKGPSTACLKTLKVEISSDNQITIIKI